MESYLQDLADDPAIYVVCPYTNEILKKGTGSLEDADTWDMNVIYLTSIDTSRAFRELMNQHRLHTSWAKEWNPEDDDTDEGNLPVVAPDPAPRSPKARTPAHESLAA